MDYKIEDRCAVVEDYQYKMSFGKKESIVEDRLKVVSLFSGCGGFDLGFRGGFTFRGKEYSKTLFSTVFANDINKAAVAVYEKNKQYFGDSEVIEGDIREIPSRAIPDFDVMIAGFPCQPFSSAGLRKGISDDRGNLFEECERIISSKSKKPKVFIFENVRGILSSKMEDGTTVPDAIVQRTKKMGYNTTYKLVKASNYGVPSARYRVIMVGVREDLGVFDFSLLDDIVKEYNLPNEENNVYELLLGSVLSDIPEDTAQYKDYWKYSPSGQYMVDKIGPCFGDETVLQAFKAKKPIREMNEDVKQGRSWKVMDPEDMSPRFRKIYDNPKKYRSPNFYRRFALAEINGTIIASAQPENCGITHPLYNRRFTIREIARIQSFPDNFEFPYTTIANAYQVIGNAVPPVLGWVIAKAVEKFLKKNEN